MKYRGTRAFSFSQLYALRSSLSTPEASALPPSFAHRISSSLSLFFRILRSRDYLRFFYLSRTRAISLSLLCSLLAPFHTLLRLFCSFFRCFCFFFVYISRLLPLLLLLLRLPAKHDQSLLPAPSRRRQRDTPSRALFLSLSFPHSRELPSTSLSISGYSHLSLSMAYRPGMRSNTRHILIIIACARARESCTELLSFSSSELRALPLEWAVYRYIL